VSLRTFITKQLIDVIQWVEPGDGILAYRFPMQDMEIQNGGTLTVRESQMAAFVNEGRIADVFGPGLYTLNTRTLPVLTNLMNWDKMFQSPFKSDVYFFSTRLQTNQRWGTANPITIRDKEFGAVRLRAPLLMQPENGTVRDAAGVRGPLAEAGLDAGRPIALCRAIISRRLSTRSAMTPPSNAKSSVGRLCNAVTTPREKGECVRIRTSHPWATFCIQVPAMETVWPAK